MKKTLEGLQRKADKLKNNGKINDAIRTYLEIVEISKKSEQYVLTAEALRLAGLSAILAIKDSNSSKYRDSVKYLLAAERVYKEIGNNVKIGGIYRDVAVANIYAGYKAESLKYFQRSIEVLTNNNRLGSLAVTYNKLGLYYYLSNDLETAVKYMEKSLKLFKQDPIRGYYQAEAWIDYARILAKKEDTQEAMEWAEQSLDWYLADHDGEVFSVMLSQLYGMLSVLYDQVRKDKLAKKYAVRYEKLLKGFDPEVSQGIREQLNNTFNYEK